MDDLLTALGLVLIIEGALYALATAAMRRMMIQALALPEDLLRRAGLTAAVVGTLLVWIARRFL